MRLDYDFFDPSEGLTETPNDCFFDAAIPRHPRLKFALRRERFKGGVHAGPHKHCDFFALYLIRGGRGTHEIGGVRHEISRGDAYLLAPGSVHGYRDYRDLSLDGFYFPFEFLEAREIELLGKMPGFGALFRGETGRHLRLETARHERLELQIERLRAEYVSAQPGADYLLRTGFLSLMIELAREVGEPQMATPPPFGHALGVLEVKRFCETTRGDLPTPAQMARLMLLSQSHFRAVWKHEIGVSPGEFLRDLRLKRAKTRLQSGASVQSVAREEGFADAAHFCRDFKKSYGVSPRVWLENSRTSSSNRAA